MWFIKELYRRYKAYRISKRLNRSLQAVTDILGKHIYLRKEVVYPKFKVYNCVKFNDYFLSPAEQKTALKCANTSRLPIVKAEKYIRVTQVPCSPLKFVPADE